LAAKDSEFTDTPETMKLSVGRSVVLDRASDVARISISNPDVVDAVAVTMREILINAKSARLSTLVIWSKTGTRNVYAVTVERDLEPVRRLLKESFPDEAIDVRADRDALALIGHASNQAVADRATALLAPMAKTVVNNLQVVPPGADRQIILRVKFAELNRNVENTFGINLLSTGATNTPGRISTGQFSQGTPSQVGAGTANSFTLSDALNIFAFRPDLNLGVVIRDLQTSGLLQILAEPNLVTTNGKEASFLGGWRVSDSGLATWLQRLGNHPVPRVRHPAYFPAASHRSQDHQAPREARGFNHRPSQRRGFQWLYHPGAGYPEDRDRR
jgi:pilus assembly protein CpaC